MPMITKISVVDTYAAAVALMAEAYGGEFCITETTVGNMCIDLDESLGGWFHPSEMPDARGSLAYVGGEECGNVSVYIVPLANGRYFVVSHETLS